VSEHSAEKGAPVIFEFDTYAIDVTWDRPGLPGLVGPFPRRDEAEAWAALNIPNGSWEVRPLAWPYYRSTSVTPPVEKGQADA
jgi:hypothetical protein